MEEIPKLTEQAIDQAVVQCFTQSWNRMTSQKPNLLQEFKFISHLK